MTLPSRRFSPGTVLAGLFVLVVLVVLIAPAEETGGSLSSYSAGPTGARLGYDLASRLGWRTERRLVPFSDSIVDPAAVQVLLNTPVAGAEARALLHHARSGGSLLVVGDAGALSDSLPVVPYDAGEALIYPNSPSCARSTAWSARLFQFGRMDAIGWKRPPPADTVGYGVIMVHGARRRAGVGYPFGAGRVVVVVDTGFVVNDVLRRCEMDADVSFVRMLEYLSRGVPNQRVAFDEYHHGFGVHGGSFTAIRMYLGGTGSGRMLAQMTVAGLLLLFAAAPRPLAPRDPVRVVRRSPLEHADALAHAYMGVQATRTATARLLAGVRRRARRDRVKTRESDEQLLAAAGAISPASSAAASVVARALEAPVGERDLSGVAAAISTIESALTARPTSPTR